MIEFIKENISLWKTACIGLAVALLGSLVAISGEWRTSNELIVQGSKPEVFLLMQLSYSLMAYICLYTFFGPVCECAAKIKTSIHNLKEIEAEPRKESSTIT